MSRPATAASGDAEADRLRSGVSKTAKEFLEAYDTIVSDLPNGLLEHVVTTWMISKGVAETHADEFIDCVVETDQGAVDKDALVAGIKFYEEQRAALQGAANEMLNEMKETDIDVNDQAKMGGMVSKYVSTLALPAKQVLKGLQVCAKLRTLEAFLELVKANDGIEALPLVSDAVRKMQATELNEHLTSFSTTVETDIIEMVTNNSSLPRLQRMWKDVDRNDTDKVSIWEMYQYSRKTFPYLAVPAALTKVYQEEASDDGWVKMDELPRMLVNLVAYNKLQYIFAARDRLHGKFDKNDLLTAAKQGGIVLNNAEVDAEFGQLNKDGSINFKDLGNWLATKRLDGLTLVTLQRAKTAEEVRQDASVAAGIYDSSNELVQAILTNEVENVRALIHAQRLEERVDYVNQVTQNGDTIIFYALEPERIDILQLLLDYGADPTYHNNDRNTPLHIICQRSFKKAIKMVILCGADMNAENGGFQKAHQMVKGDAQVQAMQNLLNVTSDQVKAMFKDKIVLPCTRQQRAFCKSMFDIIDHQGLGRIRFQEMAPALSIIYDGTEVTPEPEHMLQFFSSFDMNFMGTITFDEFLFSMTTYLNSKEPKGKGKKGKKGSKKKK